MDYTSQHTGAEIDTGISKTKKITITENIDLDNILSENIIYDNSTSGLTATDAQTAIDELESEKANKVQEDWIYPTLLNGWSGNIRYAKNDVGLVIIEVDATMGTVAYGTKIFAFPVGYVSYAEFNGMFQDASSSGLNVVELSAKPNGDFVCKKGTEGRTARGTFIFKAV